MAHVSGREKAETSNIFICKVLQVKPKRSSKLRDKGCRWQLYSQARVALAILLAKTEKNFGPFPPRKQHNKNQTKQEAGQSEAEQNKAEGHDSLVPQTTARLTRSGTDPALQHNGAGLELSCAEFELCGRNFYRL